MSAFKDYTPGSGGGAASAPAAAALEEPKEDQEDDEELAAESSGAGDYPPHTVMGLPALSPTMSQGVLQHPSLITVTGSWIREAAGSDRCERNMAGIVGCLCDVTIFSQLSELACMCECSCHVLFRPNCVAQTDQQNIKVGITPQYSI